MFHVERLGVQFVKIEKKKPVRFVRCMLCQLIYDYHRHGQCPNCRKGNPQVASLVY